MTGCQRVVEPAFRPAADIIDWSLLGQRIGDRQKPLAPKTLARIQAGIDRYWAPFVLDNNHVNRGRGVDEPMPTMTTATTKGLVVPVEGRDGKSAQEVSEALRTQTTRNETGLAFLSVLRGQSGNHSADQPISTVSAGGIHHGLVQPFIAELRGGGSDARATSEALATVTASGNHHGLVTTYYGNGGTRPSGEALATVTATERHALLMRNNTARGDQGQMTTPASEAIRTVTTKGHQSLLTADRPTVDVNDVLFRMLEPREIKGAMDFPHSYLLLGNRREQVRLAGNAVTPPAARDLVGVVTESLGVA